MKKISTLAGILIIIATAIILFGGVFAWEKSNPKPETQNLNSETAGWKTYKSNIWDYEIKFPPTYEISPGFISTPHTGSDIDNAHYTDQDGYHFGFAVFARNEDFIVRDCLKDLTGNDIAKTKEVNGNTFYIFNEKEQGTGGRMALMLGGVSSEYNIMHNGYCYIVEYTMAPLTEKTPLPSQSDANVRFKILDQIFSTFKFTK